LALLLSNYLTREEWLNRYDKPSSRHFASYSLTAFDLFLDNKFKGVKESELLQNLRQSQGDEKYVFLNNMVQFWRDHKQKIIMPNGAKREFTKGATTIRTYFIFIRSYLRANRIKTDQETIKDFVRFPKKIKERRKPLSREQIEKMLSFCNMKYKAYFLCEASGGFRGGELLGLKLSNFNFNSDPVLVTIPGPLTKTGEERETYISNEAVKALKLIILNKKPNDTIFNMKKGTVQAYIQWLRKKCGFLKKYSNNVNYHVNNHRFRGFCKTNASNVHGQDYAEALIGHGEHTDPYYGNPENERAEMYKQIMPKVTINQEEKLKVTITQQDKKLEELETAKQMIREQDARIKRLEDLNK